MQSLQKVWAFYDYLTLPATDYRSPATKLISCTTYPQQHRRYTVFCPTAVGLQSDLSRSRVGAESEEVGSQPDAKRVYYALKQ